MVTSYSWNDDPEVMTYFSEGRFGTSRKDLFNTPVKKMASKCSSCILDQLGNQAMFQ
jgi:hypothetical protein